MRVISLVPSVTETLSAWDRTPIACTRFCERDDLEHVGGTKNPSIDHIVELAPDLVVVDAEENRREDYEALLARGLVVHVLHVRDVTDVNPMMADLARRVGATWRPVELGPEPPARRRAFVPIWRRPWMALGKPTYGSSLLSRVGVRTVSPAPGPYPVVDLDEVRAEDPDLVLAPTEPYSFRASHLRELEGVAPTVVVDGKDLFWWGSRTAEALQRLEALVVAWP